MPYVHPEVRKSLDDKYDTWSPDTAGELNYVLTRALNAYLETKGLSYGTINDIVGALEGAKLEFYRRVAVPYEDGKLIDNGDVYTRSTWGTL